MNTILSLKKPGRVTLAFLTGMLFFCQNAIGQVQVSGTVKESNANPIAGVTVSNANTGKATITDTSGSFTLAARPGDIIICSSIGFRTTRVVVPASGALLIMLPLSIHDEEEIRLIGYGSTRKKNLTGAIEHVHAEHFNTGLLANPILQLQGRVPGMTIVQPGGDPNADIILRIRGATSLEGQPPLVVIDGVAFDDAQKALQTLDPSSIETYDILKDASAAAIYGTRGANGVLLITTKAGHTGKTTLEYDGQVSIAMPTRKLDLLDAAEWRKLTANDPSAPTDMGGNTDWQSEIMRNAFGQHHWVSASGGTDQLHLRGSVGYTHQEGLIRNNGRKNYDADLHISQGLFQNRLRLQYGLRYAVIDRDLLMDQQTTDQYKNGGSQIHLLAYYQLPVWPTHAQDGEFFRPPYLFNPLNLTDNLISTRSEEFVVGQFKGDYRISNSLSFGVQFSGNSSNDELKQFWPRYQTLPGQATRSLFRKRAFSEEWHGTYRLERGHHQLQLTAVYENNLVRNDGFGLTASGFDFSAPLTNNLGSANTISSNDIRSYKNEVRLISFLARAIYNFDDRYLLTVNFRRDGSSAFGEDHRWGNFPSVGLAWRIGRERSLANRDWLDELKIRASFGLTGNQGAIPANGSLPLFGATGLYRDSTGSYRQSYAMSQEANPDLKWEVRTSLNIGLDLSLWHDRLFASFNVFRDRTKDMLYQYALPQPPFTMPTVVANAAQATNHGMEWTIGGSPVRSGRFEWLVRANGYTIRNRITGLDGKFQGITLGISNPSYGYARGGSLPGAAITRIHVGYPIGVFWIPVHAGFDGNGNELFENYDEQGKFSGVSTDWSDKDRRYIDPSPSFSWGLENEFRIGKLRFSFLLRGVHGSKAFNNTLLLLGNASSFPYLNVTHSALTDPLKNVPAPSTYWLMNATFVRLEQTMLSYTLDRAGPFRSLTVSMTGSNLLLFTGYKGDDPEVSVDGPQRYIDLATYPRSRGVTLGVHLQL